MQDEKNERSHDLRILKMSSTYLIKIYNNVKYIKYSQKLSNEGLFNKVCFNYLSIVLTNVSCVNMLCNVIGIS